MGSESTTTVGGATTVRKHRTGGARRAELAAHQPTCRICVRAFCEPRRRRTCCSRVARRPSGNRRHTPSPGRTTRSDPGTSTTATSQPARHHTITCRTDTAERAQHPHHNQHGPRPSPVEQTQLNEHSGHITASTAPDCHSQNRHN